MPCEKKGCKIEGAHLHATGERRTMEEVFGEDFDFWNCPDHEIIFIDHEMIMRKK